MSSFGTGVLLITLAVLLMGGAIYWMSVAVSYARALIIAMPAVGLAMVLVLAGALYVTT